MKKMSCLVMQKQIEQFHEQQQQSMKDAQKKTSDILNEENFPV